MVTTKICSTCRRRRSFDKFGRNCKSPGGRLARCKDCDREIRLARYRSDPRVRAGFIWSALLQRVGNADGKNSSYADVKVTFTREQFVAWYADSLPAFFAEFGTSATPSVDRIEAPGHYTPGNVQIIPLGDNAAKASNKRNLRAPHGTAWCTHCQKYLPRDKFYKNRAQPHGLQHMCKEHFKASRQLA